MTLHDSYTLFIELLELYLDKMIHVLFFDLRHGSFVSILDKLLQIYHMFLSVKVLYLTHQGLQSLSPIFINGPNIIHVNLSCNFIHTVQNHAFALMQNVRTLSLESNKLQTLEQYFSRDLRQLKYLYLHNNPLLHIAANVFLENPGLMGIRSDWYMLCCVAIETPDCQSYNQFVSSCSNLISSLAQRIVIIAESVIILTGNIGALAIQYATRQGSETEKYLVVSLTLADLLMGIYLITVACIDLTCISRFYNIVSEWSSGRTYVLYWDW